MEKVLCVLFERFGVTISVERVTFPAGTEKDYLCIEDRAGYISYPLANDLGQLIADAVNTAD